MKIFRMIFGGIKEVQVDRYLEDLNTTEHIVLDVRNKTEFDGGHIDGAKNIALGKLPKKMSQFSKDEPIVCVCRDGLRAREAVHMLKNAGFNASNLVGGMREYTDKGGEVVSS